MSWSLALLLGVLISFAERAMIGTLYSRTINLKRGMIHRWVSSIDFRIHERIRGRVVSNGLKHSVELQGITDEGAAAHRAFLCTATMFGVGD